MTLQKGPNDPSKVAGYDRAELIREARRLANNHAMMYGEYTGAVLARMADLVEGGK